MRFRRKICGEYQHYSPQQNKFRRSYQRQKEVNKEIILFVVIM